MRGTFITGGGKRDSLREGAACARRHGLRRRCERRRCRLTTINPTIAGRRRRFRWRARSGGCWRGATSCGAAAGAIPLTITSSSSESRLWSHHQRRSADQILERAVGMKDAPSARRWGWRNHRPHLQRRSRPQHSSCATVAARTAALSRHIDRLGGFDRRHMIVRDPKTIRARGGEAGPTRREVILMPLMPSFRHLAITALESTPSSLAI